MGSRFRTNVNLFTVLSALAMAVSGCGMAESLNNFASPTQAVVNLGSVLEIDASEFKEVKLVSGEISPFGNENGSLLEARFNHPFNVIENGGFLFVADTNNHVIRKIDLTTKTVSDFVGDSGVAGSADGIGNQAQFNGPTGMVVTNGFMYVSDTNNCSIRRVDMLTRQVTLFAGASLSNGTGLCEAAKDGVGTKARFYYPHGLAVDGNTLYVADSGNHSIRRITLPGGSVSTLISSGGGTLYSNPPIPTDGDLSVARTQYPMGLALWTRFDQDNVLVEKKLFIMEGNNSNRLRALDLIAPTVTLSTVTASVGGFVDGVGPAARLRGTGAIAIYGDRLYISDTLNDALRVVELSSFTVTTLVGGPTIQGYKNGPATVATVYRPGGIAFLNNNLYFTDIGNQAIRKLDLITLNVSTVSGYRGSN